jgi:hypothetical protein
VVKQSYYGHAVAQVPTAEPFRQSATLWKMQFNRVPTKAVATIMTIAISAAINPYSMAVTPSSSLMKCLRPAIMLFMVLSLNVKQKTAQLTNYAVSIPENIPEKYHTNSLYSIIF